MKEKATIERNLSMTIVKKRNNQTGIDLKDILGAREDYRYDLDNFLEDNIEELNNFINRY